MVVVLNESRRSDPFKKKERNICDVTDFLDNVPAHRMAARGLKRNYTSDTVFTITDTIWQFDQERLGTL